MSDKIIYESVVIQIDGGTSGVQEYKIINVTKIQPGIEGFISILAKSASYSYPINKILSLSKLNKS